MRKIQPKTAFEHPLAAKLLSGVLMTHARQRNDSVVMKEARELANLADEAQQKRGLKAPTRRSQT